MPRLVLGSLLAILLLAFFLYWLSGDPALPTRDPAGSAPSAAQGPATAEGVGEDVQPLPSEGAPTGAESPRTSDDAAAAVELESAEIEYRFIDAVTGRAVPGVEYAVWSEHTAKQYARGFADDAGRAIVRGLPLEKTILVESGRTEVHAHSLQASWLNEKRRHFVDVELQEGGVAVGRVLLRVDGPPVSGAEIRLERSRPGRNRYLRDEVVVGHTNGRGEFRIERITKRGNGVWATAEGAKPDKYDPAFLTFSFARDGERYFLRARCEVAHGEVKDLGDLHPGDYLDALRGFEGTVLRSDGTPAAGVLVSADPRRIASLSHPKPNREPVMFEEFARFPGDPRLGLTSDETITENDGTFRIESTAPGNVLLFVTERGDVHPERVYRTTKPRVFRLPESEPLFVRFVDESGADRAIDSYWQGRWENLAKIGVRSREGVRAESDRVYPVAGGAYRVALEARIDQALDVTINVPGFEPCDHRLATQITAGAEVEILLEPEKPEDESAFFLRFRTVRDELGLHEPEWRSLELCALPPEKRAGNRDCCGLSVTRRFPDGLPNEIEIEVPSELEYWVRTRASTKATGTLRSRLEGPFEPGSAVHELKFGRHEEIEITPQVAKALAMQREAQEQIRLLEQSTARGTVIVALEAPWIEPFGPSVIFWSTRAEVERKQLDELTFQFDIRGIPGEHELSASCSNHNEVKRRVRFVDGETIDFGRINLSVVGPELTIRFVDEKGDPVVGADVHVAESWGAEDTDDSGLSRFRTKSTVVIAAIQVGGRMHWGRVEFDSDAEPDAVVVVPDSVTAVLSLTGIDESLVMSEISLQVDQLDPAGDLDGIASLLANEPSKDETTRSVTFIASPGRYRIRGGTGLFQFDESVELQATKSVQRFSLSAKRQ